MSFIPRSRRPGWADAGLRIATITVALTMAACGSPRSATVERRSTITVFAASSLTEPFTAVAEAFEAGHPGVQVNLSFGASSSLVNQMAQGAPVDVLALVEPALPRAQELDNVVGPPTIFAENELAIITTRGNPHRVATLADLSRADLVVVIGSPETPIGDYSAQLLSRAGTTVRPASYEPNVKAVVAKVTSGEADVGLVYTSDVKAVGSRAEGIAIPPEQNIIARYATLVVASAKRRPDAEAFVAAVTSPQGRNLLIEAGFTTP